MHETRHLQYPSPILSTSKLPGLAHILPPPPHPSPPLRETALMSPSLRYASISSELVVRVRGGRGESGWEGSLVEREAPNGIRGNERLPADQVTQLTVGMKIQSSHYCHMEREGGRSIKYCASTLTLAMIMTIFGTRVYLYTSSLLTTDVLRSWTLLRRLQWLMCSC